MSRKQVTDLAASVRQRLLNLARARGEDFNLTLTRYASERLLYRLSVSPYADRFVLKGALLFAVWTGHMHRPTRDVDVLGFGDNTSAALEEIFRDMCAAAVPGDGLDWDADAIRIIEIRENQEYQGHRVHLLVRLGNATIELHVDVGIGDVIVPAPEKVAYPTLLDFPTPRLRAYSKESVVAEKLHAMVVLGIANSRLKDFYDLWIMAREFAFDGATLARAIAATFERRGTPVPEDLPVALTDGFARDQAKMAQWQAFLKRSSLMAPVPQLASVISSLRDFFSPLLTPVAPDRFAKRWPPGGPWI